MSSVECKCTHDEFPISCNAGFCTAEPLENPITQEKQNGRCVVTHDQPVGAGCDPICPEDLKYTCLSATHSLFDIEYVCESSINKCCNSTHCTSATKFQDDFILNELHLTRAKCGQHIKGRWQLDGKSEPSLTCNEMRKLPNMPLVRQSSLPVIVMCVLLVVLLSVVGLWGMWSYLKRRKIHVSGELVDATEMNMDTEMTGLTSEIQTDTGNSGNVIPSYPIPPLSYDESDESASSANGIQLLQDELPPSLLNALQQMQQMNATQQTPIGLNKSRETLEPPQFCKPAVKHVLPQTNVDGALVANIRESTMGSLPYFTVEEATVFSSSGGGSTQLYDRKATRNIQKHMMIGKGGFSQVYYATDNTNRQLAVKVVYPRDEAQYYVESTILNMRLLNHPNVVNFLMSDTIDTGTRTELWLVMEHYPRGSLYDFLTRDLSSDTDFIITDVQIKGFISGLVAGLAYIHTEEVLASQRRPRIAHRDIKSKNILIKSFHDTCVIADFGLAVSYDSETGELFGTNYTSSHAGTIRYLAPEFILGEADLTKFSSFERADTYSMALVFWEMLHCGIFNSYMPPYGQRVNRMPTHSDMLEIFKIDPKERPTINDCFHDRFQGLSVIMEECWQSRSDARPSAMNVLKKITAQLPSIIHAATT